MKPTLALAKQLIAQKSVTPEDANCQQLIAARLQPLGFACETLRAGPADFRVTNLWAERTSGAGRKLLVFAGHTDVVPTGPLNWWHSPPFEPTERDGKLYGRGAADMKSSLAAMVVASEEFLAQQPQAKIDIAFLLTSDEEGPTNRDGTVVVVEALKNKNHRIDYCIVGEPTAMKTTGDMIKNGRRGSMSGKLKVKGIQGHIAYPHLARNPLHQFAPALAELVAIEWDRGNEYFPATSWQVSNVHAGTGVGNVIPGELVLDFNFRYCTESTPASLQERLEAVLQKHGLEYQIEWTVSGLPFLTPRGDLVHAAERAIATVTGLQPELSTTGGTSDGRFVATLGAEVVELGPINASIHQVDECVLVEDISRLHALYEAVARECLTRNRR